MTIPIEKLDYKILHQLIRNPSSISMMEATLLTEVCNAIAEGHRTTESILNYVNPPTIDEMKLLTYFATKELP